MNVTRGIVNEHLLPIVSVSVEKEGNNWAELDMLLDTGFNDEIALDPSLPDKHCLATQPQRQLLPPDEVLESLNNWEGVAPYKLKMRWRGVHRETSLRLFRMGPGFSGMLGTELLRYQFVTVDVVEGGSVIVESANSRPDPRRIPWRRQRRVRQVPSVIDNEDEYLKWSTANFPWTILPVQDHKGEWRTLWVTVDTGYSGALSLPTSCINKLGLTLLRESKIKTPRGRETVKIGDAMVKWHGKERSVKCEQREEHPPLIGMKLLEDYRVTMDFFYPGPEIEIGRIPRLARAEKGLVDSLANIFRRF